MKKNLVIFILLFASIIVNAQGRKITGLVKTTDGLAIPGATVSIQGTTTGMITDIDGKFTLETSPKSVNLVISFIGFETRVIPLSNKSYFDVVMREDVKQLDEVVIVGYGSQKRANLTGAVGTIDASSIENRPITSASQSLSGKIAGVHVAQGSGIAGADGAQITIRGLGTLNNTSPLILIDGVISPNFDMLNPNDIESISVLKDAASASIYGSQSGNGVVLITTKKGSSDKKPTFTYDAGYSISEITRQSKPQMIKDPEVFMKLMNEARKNSGLSTAFSDEVIEQYRTPSYRDVCSVDWFNEIFKKGVIREHNISARGGTEKTQYFMSLGYMGQDGIILDGQYQRITARINLETEIVPKVKMGTNFGYTYGNQRTPNGSINDNSLLSIMRGTPLNPAYTDDGYLAIPDFKTMAFTGQVQSGNPLAEYQSNDVRQLNNNIVGNMFVEWEIFKELKLRGNFSSSLNLDNHMGWYGRPIVRNWRYKEILDDPNSTETLGGMTNYYGFGRLQEQSTKSYRLNPDLQLSYKRKIGKHNISALAGISTEKNSFDWMMTSRGRYESNYIRVFSAGDPTTIANESRISKSAIVSQFGRVNYGYADKYLFEANIRRDGSSRFGSNFRYGIFPSFSMGWILSNEDFMKKLTTINFLKLRGSWGQLGNQGWGDDFPYIAKISYSNATYVFGKQVNTGAMAASYGNPDLHWETTTISDVGINLHLFKSAIQFEADYFNKKSTNILYNTPIPQETGFSSVMSNLASVRNKGIEASLDFEQRIKKFSISAGINGSRIKNEVLSINPDLTGETDRYIGGDKILARGAAINSFYVVDWTGGISGCSSGGCYTASIRCRPWRPHPERLQRPRWNT
jgi:TonB-linked SusC/RagA family outer membrane protein